MYRFNIYVETDKELNLENSNPENTFTVGHNQFSTWTKDEFKKMLGYFPPKDYDAIEEGVEYEDFGDVDPNAGIDWRQYNVLNRIQ